MPNIREINVGPLDIRPTETGIEAQAGAARRIGAFYNQAGQAIDTLGQRAGGAVRDAGDMAVKQIDHAQISAGSAHFAAIADALGREWDNTAKNADPNDPSVAAKFREERLEPTLEKFAEGFTTENSQRFAEGEIARYRQHMFEKTAGDMSKLAADAVHVNAQTTANTLGNSVYRDPSLLDFTFKSWDAHNNGVIGSSPNLRAEDAGRVRNELDFQGKSHLVRSAIEGAIAKGAPYERIMNDPKYAPYVNQQEIQTFVAEAKRQQRADEIQQRQLKLIQKQEAESDFHTAISKAHADNERYDPATGKVIVGPNTIPQLLNARKRATDSGIDTSSIDTHLDWVKHQQEERRTPVISNQAVLSDLLSRMDGSESSFGARFSGKGQTTEEEIRRAAIKGDLSDRHTNELLGLHKAIMERPGDEPLKRDRDAFFRDFVRAIDPGFSTGQQTQLGQQNINRAKADAFRLEGELRQKNISPHELYNPESPNFMGKLLGKYHATMQDAQKFDAEQLKPAPEAKRPIPPQAIQMLRSNPSMRADFDAKYGAGQATKILGAP